MVQPRAEQINELVASWLIGTYTPTSSAGNDTIISSTFDLFSVTKTPGGDPDTDTRGVNTVSPNNIVKLRYSDSHKPVMSGNDVIYGRLTHNGTDYVVTYYIMNVTETAVVLPVVSGDFDLLFSETMEFGEVPTNSSIIGSGFAASGVPDMPLISFPIDPTDDNKVLVAETGDLSYKLIADANIDAAAGINVSKLAGGSDGQVLSTVAGSPVWGAAPAGGDENYVDVSKNSSGTISLADWGGKTSATLRVFWGNSNGGITINEDCPMAPIIIMSNHTGNQNIYCQNSNVRIVTSETFMGYENRVSSFVWRKSAYPNSISLYPGQSNDGTVRYYFIGTAAQVQMGSLVGQHFTDNSNGLFGLVPSQMTINANRLVGRIGGPNGAGSNVQVVDALVASNAAIAVSKLAAGSNGEVLSTVTGVPTWSAAPAGGDENYVDVSKSSGTIGLSDWGGKTNATLRVTWTTNNTITIGNDCPMVPIVIYRIHSGSSGSIVTISCQDSSVRLIKSDNDTSDNRTGTFNWITLGASSITLYPGQEGGTRLYFIGTAAQIPRRTLTGVHFTDNGYIGLLASQIYCTGNRVVGRVSGANGPAAAVKIVNDLVDDAAAIAGTKVAPNFGAQTVQTTGPIIAGSTGNGSYLVCDNGAGALATSGQIRGNGNGGFAIMAGSVPVIQMVQGRVQISATNAVIGVHNSVLFEDGVVSGSCVLGHRSNNLTVPGKSLTIKGQSINSPTDKAGDVVLSAGINSDSGPDGNIVLEYQGATERKYYRRAVATRISGVSTIGITDAIPIPVGVSMLNIVAMAQLVGNETVDNIVTGTGGKVSKTGGVIDWMYGAGDPSTKGTGEYWQLDTDLSSGDIQFTLDISGDTHLVGLDLTVILDVLVTITSFA